MCVPMLAWLSVPGALEGSGFQGVVSLTLTVAGQRSLVPFLYLIYVPNASSPNVSIWNSSCPLSKVRNRAKKRGVKVEEEAQTVKGGSQLELKVDLLPTFRCHDQPPHANKVRKRPRVYSHSSNKE